MGGSGGRLALRSHGTVMLMERSHTTAIHMMLIIARIVSQWQIAIPSSSTGGIFLYDEEVKIVSSSLIDVWILDFDLFKNWFWRESLYNFNLLLTELITLICYSDLINTTGKFSWKGLHSIVLFSCSINPAQCHRAITLSNCCLHAHFLSSSNRKDSTWSFSPGRRFLFHSQ